MSRAIRFAALMAGLLAACLSGAASGQEGDVVVDGDMRWPEDAYVLDSLTVDGASLRLASGSTLDLGGAIEILNGGTLILEGANVDAMVDGAWRGESALVRAADVTVAAGAALSADGQGYVGTAGPGAGSSDGNCAGVTAGGGGGHGGAAYDSPAAPADLGSGGGGRRIAVYSEAGAGFDDLTRAVNRALAGCTS